MLVNPRPFWINYNMATKPFFHLPTAISKTPNPDLDKISTVQALHTSFSAGPHKALMVCKVQ